MIKDIYLFTDGSLAVFDAQGQQIFEYSVGRLDEEKKKKIKADWVDTTRIIFSRWKAGFFELTKEEFLNAMVAQDLDDPFDGKRFQLEFKIEEGKPNEANRTS